MVKKKKKKKKKKILYYNFNNIKIIYDNNFIYHLC